MSLHPQSSRTVPRQTARIARAAFPKDNLYLRWRDELGIMYRDEDFAHLYPADGQPALCPWRLALVTIMQFVENLSDRQAAEAVRGRIDWKYVLGLELTDAGFNHSVLCEFRQRLIHGDAHSLLLDRMLEHLSQKKLLKARGRQRTDSTHVLACIRVMNRLELITETLRAALNELATVAPDWLRSVALPQWFERYSLRAEQSRLPRTEGTRQLYAQKVAQDGLLLLSLVEQQKPELAHLEKLVTLRQVWERHFEVHDNTQDNSEAGSELGEAQPEEPPNTTHSSVDTDSIAHPCVVFKGNAELSLAATAVESPYDTQARHCTKRELTWSGYKAHLSETCDSTLPRVITHVHTTVATTQDVTCTADIHHALAQKNLLPSIHLVDAGYIDSRLLVESQNRYDIELFGPTRINPSWQALSGGYDQSHFTIDWDNQKATCPQGKVARWWNTLRTRGDKRGEHPGRVKVSWSSRDCGPCPNRVKCVRSKTGSARSLVLPLREHYEELQQMRTKIDTATGRREYARRSGIEGSLSQAVRCCDLRHSRCRGLAKTHLQHIATASALNVIRCVYHLQHRPLAQT